MNLLSLDISTSCIGFSYFSDDEVRFGYIKIDDIENLLDKAIKFIELTKNYYDGEIVIERFLMFFSAKHSSAHTITKLCEFQGIVQGIIFERYGKKCNFIDHTRAMRALIEKYDSKRKDKSYLNLLKVDKNTAISKILGYLFFIENNKNYIPVTNKNGKIIKENFDISDSFVNGYYFKNKIN